VDRVLRDTSPADIPVKVENKHELVINQQTAQALGLTIPKGLRKRATIIK
jgi:putative ABC transport system substrate-binding protein